MKKIIVLGFVLSFFCLLTVLFRPNALAETKRERVLAGKVLPTPTSTNANVVIKLWEPVYCYVYAKTENTANKGWTVTDTVTGQPTDITVAYFGYPNQKFFTSSADYYYNFGDSTSWYGPYKAVSQYVYPTVTKTWSSTGKYLVSVDVIDQGVEYRCRQNNAADLSAGQTFINVYSSYDYPSSLSMAVKGDDLYPATKSVSYNGRILGGVKFAYHFWGNGGGLYLGKTYNAYWKLVGSVPYSWNTVSLPTWDYSAPGAVMNSITLRGESTAITWELGWNLGRKDTVANLLISNIKLYWRDNVTKAPFLKPLR